MRSFLALLGLPALAGCFPVLARVESGFRLAAISSFAIVSDSGAESGDVARAVVPSFDLEASLGIRDTSRDYGPGLRLAASAGLGGYGGSAYVELPRDQFGDLDVGIGVATHHGALSLWSPYLQLGRREGQDMSWFLRNGVSFAAPADSSDWSILWVPTVGIALHRPSRDAGLFLSAVIGRQQRVERACFFFECFSYSNSFVRTQVMIGASVSFTLLSRHVPDRR